MPTYLEQKKLDVFSHSLTYAITTMDDFTGQPASGDIRFKIKNTKPEQIVQKNNTLIIINSGVGQKYSIPSAKFEIEINSDYYFTRKIIIQNDKYTDALTSEEIDIIDGMISLNLTPVPSYPFPAQTTLIRGTVFWEKQVNQKKVLLPISDADVKIVQAIVDGKELKTKSLDNGDFVLYVVGLDDEQVNFTTKLINKNSTSQFTVEIKKENHQTWKTDMEFFEGKNNIVNNIVLEVQN